MNSYIVSSKDKHHFLQARSKRALEERFPAPDWKIETIAEFNQRVELEAAKRLKDKENWVVTCY
jgi:hypothetical protein